MRVIALLDMIAEQCDPDVAFCLKEAINHILEMGDITLHSILNREVSDRITQAVVDFNRPGSEEALMFIEVLREHMI